MKVSEYEALPDTSEGLTEEGLFFVTDSLRQGNLGRNKRTVKHKKGDEVTYLEVSRVVEGIIVNYEVRHEGLK